MSLHTTLVLKPLSTGLRRSLHRCRPGRRLGGDDRTEALRLLPWCDLRFRLRGQRGGEGSYIISCCCQLSSHPQGDRACVLRMRIDEARAGDQITIPFGEVVSPPVGALRSVGTCGWVCAARQVELLERVFFGLCCPRGGGSDSSFLSGGTF